ncbi:RNA-binding protein [Leptospira interrogans serovar Pomona]|nr:RNA-binding protein [Leptospira interrogans serovar Pomona]
MSVNIYVGKLSYDLNEGTLGDLVRAHGTVNSVKIIMDQYSGKSKGFGFVEMSNKEEADKAIKDLDGKNVLTRNLKVNVAKLKNERC